MSESVEERYRRLLQAARPLGGDEGGRGAGHGRWARPAGLAEENEGSLRGMRRAVERGMQRRSLEALSRVGLDEKSYRR